MAGMKRGDIVTIAVSGDYGKPRPALIVQDDAFSALESVTVLRITSFLRTAPLLRIDAPPTPGNGLRSPSQIMIDKAVTVPGDKVGAVIGRLEPETMDKVSDALALFLGLTSPTPPA
jgi:mRNA interferase MazF